MNPKCENLFTKSKPKTLGGKIIQFPIIRILIAVLFIAPISILNNLMSIYVVEQLPPLYYVFIANVLNIVYFFLILYAYRLFAKYIENRESYEISKNNSVKEVGFGILIGGILVTAMVILLVLLNYYRVDSYNSWRIIINAFFLFAMGAFIQELFFRGICFRIVEEYLGSWISICIIAGIFALFHIFNENATILTTIYLLVSDILLSAAFIYTRRIWLVWGIHFGWNFFQDGIFGMPNSGISKLPSWINSSINGPGWITGGNFGIEASLFSVLLSIIIGVVILKKARDKELFVIPFWKRK